MFFHYRRFFSLHCQIIFKSIHVISKTESTGLPFKKRTCHFAITSASSGHCPKYCCLQSLHDVCTKMQICSVLIFSVDVGVYGRGGRQAQSPAWAQDNQQDLLQWVLCISIMAGIVCVGHPTIVSGGITTPFITRAHVRQQSVIYYRYMCRLWTRRGAQMR